MKPQPRAGLLISFANSEAFSHRRPADAMYQDTKSVSLGFNLPTKKTRKRDFLRQVIRAVLRAVLVGLAESRRPDVKIDCSWHLDTEPGKRKNFI